MLAVRIKDLRESFAVDTLTVHSRIQSFDDGEVECISLKPRTSHSAVYHDKF